jgi:hypothetical protein
MYQHENWILFAFSFLGPVGAIRWSRHTARLDYFYWACSNTRKNRQWWRRILPEICQVVATRLLSSSKGKTMPQQDTTALQ